MNANELGILIAIAKSIPDTAAQIATAAAEAAAESAEEAASRNYGITVSGTTLTITEATT